MDQYDSDDEYKGRPGVPVDFGRLIQALRRHWRVIPTCAAIGTLIGLGVAALFIKPSYTARATILWEPVASADPSDRSFLTQVDSIKLASNLKEVKKRLKLKASTDDLKEKLNLLFDGQSHLVVIEATDSTAKGSTQLANTTVDVFLDYQRNIGRDRGSEHMKRLDSDILASQAQLRNAREAYDAFRREIGVSDFEVELKLALQKVADFKQQMELSGAEALTEEARTRSLSSEAKLQPATSVAQTTMSNPDAIQLANLQTQLAGAKSHLSADHPDIQRLEAQIGSLQQKVKTPTLVSGGMSVTVNPQHAALEANITQSRVSQQAALERQQSYKRLLDESQQRLAQLSAAQGRAQQLLSAIASQETHKNELEALRVRTADQVRSAAADFRVVTPATLPDKPNPSTRRTVAVRFPLGALALALIGILGYELRGLRVHTAREAGFWANAAVIASSTWPREQTTLGALVDELSDAAPAVRGTTLVVGARVNEVPLAREIAYWLSHLTGWSQRGVIGADEPLVEDPAPPSGPTNVRISPELEPPQNKSVALARRGGESLTIAQAWDGPPHGPSLRRAARLADRVLVVIAAGTLSVAEVAALRSRLGRSNGIGLLLVGLNPEFVKLPDRVGEVERFWEARPA